MSEWQAVVDFTTATPVEDEQLSDILEALAGYGPSASMLPDRTGAGVALHVNAPCALDAATKAVSALAESDVFPGFSVTSVEATEWSLALKRLDEPVFPPVAGYAEIARMAGVSRQRAAHFPECKGFPKPVIRTSQGPLYDRHAVESWLESRNVKPGRPKTL